MLTIPIILVMAGILIGVLVKVLGRWIPLPYTVMLFAVGLVLGILSQTEWLIDNPLSTEGIRLISTMNPDFILYVFLPILVFDAAYEMDLHVFRKTLFNASMLAGPGVVICMLLTAGLVMGLKTLYSGYDASLWPYALMFGGLISATDPVAVVALLQELGTKKRFSTLVDGESLLNDGTGLVCFMMFYGAYTADGAIDNPLLYFFWVVIVSGLIGYASARLAIWLVQRVTTEEVLQNCIMLAGAYITFMLAQHALDVSGVIALVVFGHVFAQRGRPHLKPETNEWMEKFWSFMAYICNTLIFLIVGIIIATDIEFSWTMLGGIVAIWAGLCIIRYLMILVLMPILRRNGYGLGWNEYVILGWGGLRGALGMCMALMVSCNDAIPEVIREHVLVYTAGVIVLTLCVNATTSKRLVNRLHLIDGKSASENFIWSRIISTIRRSDYDKLHLLRKESYLEQADWKAVESAIIAPAEEVAADSLSADEMLYVLRRNLITHVEMKADEYYRRGILNFNSYEHITSALAVLTDYEGRHAMDDHELRKALRHRKHWWESRRRYITNACNLCRGYVLLMMESSDFIEKNITGEAITPELRQQTLGTVRSEIMALLRTASEQLDEYRRLDPAIFADAVTDKAMRMLLADERDMVDRMRADGILSAEAADTLYADIAHRQGLEIVG